MFNGSCAEALDFYVKALDGKVSELQYFEGSPVEHSEAEAKRVLHAHFHAGEIFFMVSDGQENEAATGMVHLSLDFDSAEVQQKAFDGLSEGARITMPLQDTFWGARFGMLTDKFGVAWMFNYDKPKN